MASPTQWTRVWANSRSWWWTGRPGVLQSMGLQRVRQTWVTELNWYSFFTYFLDNFLSINKWVLGFVENVSASMEIIIWLWSFNFLTQCITLTDMYTLKNPGITGVNPTWSLCMILLKCCWILLTRILFRIFPSMFIRDGCMLSHSVMYNILCSHGLHPAKLLRPWNFRNKYSNWVSISSSWRSSWPRDWTYISCTGKQIPFH